MYVRVADAIREAGLSGSRHPTDYLNFFCLAKREGPDDLAQMGFVDPEPGTAAEEVRRSRRHPIYVHSKMTVCLFTLPTGGPICSWVGLTLILIAQLPSCFCQIPISPGRIDPTVQHSNLNSTLPSP